MKTNPSSFPAKVLLFGEYTIIDGGDALAIPFHKYSGQWNNEIRDPTKGLSQFFEFLNGIEDVNSTLIEQALKEEWSFQSTIPTGYGLGSSGALSAAAFATFFPNKTNLNKLQNRLSKIESFFHGKSSGLDPLVSYIKKPIVINNSQINIIEDLPLPENVFLLDSNKKRHSKPLIEHFKLLYDADTVFQAATIALAKFNKRIIKELINGDNIKTTFEEISIIQLEHFGKMIPAEIIKIWKKGIETGRYYLKLSGAGGGGFFLVYAEDQNALENLERLS